MALGLLPRWLFEVVAGDTSRPAPQKNFPKPRGSLTGLCSDDRKINFNLPQAASGGGGGGWW